MNGQSCIFSLDYSRFVNRDKNEWMKKQYVYEACIWKEDESINFMLKRKRLTEGSIEVKIRVKMYWWVDAFIDWINWDESIIYLVQEEK